MGCASSKPTHKYPRPVRHLKIPGLPESFSLHTKEKVGGVKEPTLVKTPTRGRLSVSYPANATDESKGTKGATLLDKLDPPDAESTTEAPLTQLPLAAVASASMTGFDPERPKQNQDNFAATASFMGDPAHGLFAVFDGHGPNGHRVSKLLASSLGQSLQNEMDRSLPLPTVVKRGFTRQNDELLKSSVDCAISGATCAALLLTTESALTAHVGDCRCVAGVVGADGQIESCEWTCDQKPDLPDEEARLLAAGARLAPLGEGHGGQQINRVWLPDRDTPGIAVSRSFGDTIATALGVISEPVVAEWQLTASIRFILLATDGIWEFIGSQEAVEMVWATLNSGRDVHSAAHKLVVEASRRVRAQATADGPTDP